MKTTLLAALPILAAACSSGNTPNMEPLSGSFHGAPFTPMSAVAMPRRGGYVVRVSNSAVDCQDYLGKPAPGRITVDLLLPASNEGAYAIAGPHMSDGTYQNASESDSRLGMTSVEPDASGSLHFTARNITEGTVFVLPADAGKLGLSFAISSHDVILKGRVTAMRCPG
jgi:hypothetical protein